MAGIQRDGWEYEVTISLEIDDEHNASCSKDRTGLFADKGKFRITPETGQIISNWCRAGKSLQDIKVDIQKATSVDQLRNILRIYPNLRGDLEPLCISRKNQIENPIAEVNHP